MPPVDISKSDHDQTPIIIVSKLILYQSLPWVSMHINQLGGYDRPRQYVLEAIFLYHRTDSLSIRGNHDERALSVHLRHCYIANLPPTR